MVTYVINTSENKTFDSDQLFRLAGYKKIHWLNIGLNKIEKCIDYIKNKQGAIESEEFRISVLVDFFGFDKIRKPFGKENYAEDNGVECGLYLPYIEGYLKDKLFYALEKQDLYSSDYEVFYIKNDKIELIDNVDNLKEQTDQIIKPVESTFRERRKNYVKDMEKVYVSSSGDVYTEEEYNKIKSEIEELNKRLYEKLTKKEREETLDKIQDLSDEIDDLKAKTIEVKKVIEEDAYTAFKLYCTEDMSLEFDINEFPYVVNVSKKDGISKRQFFEAFNDRTRKGKKIRRHFYSTSPGGSPAKAAFENLALSLNLVRLYEREDVIKEEGEIEVSAVNAKELKDLLLLAWNKIIQAKKVARENNSLYFALKNIFKDESANQEVKKVSFAENFASVRSKIYIPYNSENDSIEKQYSIIMNMGKKGEKVFLDEDKEEFDAILTEYLKKRNDITEREVEDEFQDRIKTDRLDRTNQCPPKQECDYLVGLKQDEISKLMGNVLEAEYSVQKFEQEQKSAKKYYKKYLEAKKILQRGTVGDIIFLVLTLLTVILPYVISKAIVGFKFNNAIIIVLCSLAFFALFLLSFFISVLPSIKKMNKMKKMMRECYKDCLAKKKIALQELRHRYEVDLIAIEELRYEIRQIVYLYQLNVKKDRNVNVHRNVLDSVEDCLSTILNNLGIHPVIDSNIGVDGEFNIHKPILSYENKVYRVFSLDAIETLLAKNNKGGIELWRQLK